MTFNVLTNTVLWFLARRLRCTLSAQGHVLVSMRLTIASKLSIAMLWARTIGLLGQRTPDAASVLSLSVIGYPQIAWRIRLHNVAETTVRPTEALGKTQRYLRASS